MIDRSSRRRYATSRIGPWKSAEGAPPGKGKAKYSNQERRHREAAYRLRRDAKAREVSKVFDEIRDEEREVVAEINRLQDKKIILLVALGAPLPSDTIDLEEDKKYPF